MTQALYRKWRPRRWDQVVGQEHIIQTLRNAVTTDRIAHAYLFAGPRGTGKTTTARLLAKAVNCLDPELSARPCDKCEHCVAVNEGRFLDLIEIDAASNTSVEDVRDLRDRINFAPNQGKYKFYVLDESHMLSTAAFNALLKTLEEPPPHAIFTLATTEAHKIPTTVSSRCQRHEFRLFPVADIVSQLRYLVDKEDIQTDEEVLTLVARQATGSMRDAISLLDQLASTAQTISLKMAQDVLGTAPNQVIIDIIDALIDRDPGEGLDLIHRALDTGTDPRQFARQIVDYLRNILLVRMSNASQVDVPAELRERMANQAQAFTTLELTRVIQVFNRAATEMRTSWQPSLPLELAFVEWIEVPMLEPAAQTHQELPRATQNTHASPTRKAKTDKIPPTFHEPVEAGTVGGLTLSNVQAHWHEVLSAVRKFDPRTQALLRSCQLLELKGNDLFLGFASEVLKSRMEIEEHIEIAKKAMANILGANLRIRCVISSERFQTLPDEVDSDGIVATAIRLGGEIVDSREINPQGKTK